MKTQEKSLYKILIDTRERFNKKIELVELIGDKKRSLGIKQGNLDVSTAVKELLKKNNLTVTDVSNFVADTNPGSFTGLKIGYTVANVLNWVNSKKIDELTFPKYGKMPNIQV